MECPIWNIQYGMSNMECPIWNVQYGISNMEYPILQFLPYDKNNSISWKDAYHICKEQSDELTMKR